MLINVGLDGGKDGEIYIVTAVDGEGVCGERNDQDGEDELEGADYDYPAEDGYGAAFEAEKPLTQTMWLASEGADNLVKRSSASLRDRVLCYLHCYYGIQRSGWPKTWRIGFTPRPGQQLLQ
jgi:hypothetical protein